ncbi:MAG: V-type ATP synthase subunit F, partial [Clostridia bacterium]|nr:V-type ATP synthase subunit F [Clostridia bacterium]
MKFFLISSNNDTTIGLRLAGIDGVIVRDEEEARAALERAVADESVGVVLMTERLSS